MASSPGEVSVQGAHGGHAQCAAGIPPPGGKPAGMASDDASSSGHFAAGDASLAPRADLTSHGVESHARACVRKPASDDAMSVDEDVAPSSARAPSTGKLPNLVLACQRQVQDVLQVYFAGFQRDLDEIVRDGLQRERLEFVPQSNHEVRALITTNITSLIPILVAVRRVRWAHADAGRELRTTALLCRYKGARPQPPSARPVNLGTVSRSCGRSDAVR